MVCPTDSPMRRAAGLVAPLLACMLAVGCTATSVAPPVGPAAVASTTPAAPASATTAVETAKPFTLRIGSVQNFRDVAGDGLQLPNGHRMAQGVVFRSARLATSSAADRKLLARSGFSDIIDLRTDGVAGRSPDPRIPGVERHLVNIYAVRETPSVTFRTEAAARRHMKQMNIGFVRDGAQRARVATALRMVANADGRVIVHCTEGKDRTGWISALLQMVAGADREQVLSEYLKSNSYRANLIRADYRKTLAADGAAAARARLALLKVDASYLEAGLLAMDERYGGVEGYLEEGLGLSADTINTLRERLVA